MPPGYVVAGAGPGQAGIVVRATSCDAVSIGLSPGAANSGVSDRDQSGCAGWHGRHHNYTLIYVTSNQALAAYLQIGGLPTVSNPEHAGCDLTPVSCGTNRLG